MRLYISIHAPRAGGDSLRAPILRRLSSYFNPRPPCGGRLSCVLSPFSMPLDFNPRPPCGGRPLRRRAERSERIISIHAPRAGGDDLHRQRPRRGEISIHAPRAGGDQRGVRVSQVVQPFQSTPPVRGATGYQETCRPRGRDFNPRPPCGGRPLPPSSIAVIFYFNPRPPCGGRRVFATTWARLPKFQSTPPVRGATSLVPEHFIVIYFNPRPPCGGRH